MRAFLCAVLAAVLLAGCSRVGVPTFVPGEDGVCTVPAQQMDAWVKALSRADSPTAQRMLDQAYRMADSLSVGSDQGRTLDAFARQVAGYFMNLDSPYYNEPLYDLVLDREQACVNWNSWGHRASQWRRNLLNLNRPGTRVSDFWLSKGAAAPDTLLRQLLPGAPLTVLFLYGESCPACGQLLKEIGRNRRFPALAAGGQVQFLSIYTGEDLQEFAAKSALLPPYWDNWYDREQVVRYERAFDNRMIPSLFVVDHNQLVRLRGATSAREIEKYLKKRD